jgi:N-acetylglucosaminyldiphosphoundecaprenol N-acetyl-beta-D-mannosaminyltransferase
MRRVCMESKRVSILGVPFLHTNMYDFIQLLNQRIIERKNTFVVTANPEIVMRANDDKEYMQVIQKANYITADGIGIVKAAELINQPLPGRVTGFDTMLKLLELANTNQYSVYMLGAKEEVLEKAVGEVEKDYPNLKVVGSQSGFFDWEDNTIMDEIKRLNPELVFVALGVPRQEKWIAENIKKCEKGIFIGVGGSFDVLAGAVQRAPVIWQKANLEWIYRLLKQPSRWQRVLAIPRFMVKVMGQKVKG